MGNSRFPGFKPESKKTSGANSAGAYGGVYLDEQTGQKVLIKQDVNVRNELRSDKVIAEVVTGQMLRRLMEHMQIDPEKVADVSFVTVDGSKEADPFGHNTYVCSRYFKDYQQDFWEYAYDNHKSSKPAKRPSGFGGFLPTFIQRIVNRVLRSNPQLKSDFTELSALRLFMGDFGNHCGNYGIVKKDENDRLVAFDFGAGNNHLKGIFDPYSRIDNLKFNQIHKNHFLEYGKDIIYSLEMARMFIKISDVPEKKIQEMTKEVLDKIALGSHFEQNGKAGPALCNFCKRIGMRDAKYKDLPINKVTENIQTFFQNQLIARQISLRIAGSTVALSYFYKSPGKFDLNKFNKEIKQFPEWQSMLWLLDNPQLAKEQGFSARFCKDAKEKLTVIFMCDLLNRCKQQNDTVDREMLFRILEQNKELIPTLHKFVANRETAAEVGGLSPKFLQHVETLIEGYRYHQDANKKVRIGFFEHIGDGAPKKDELRPEVKPSNSVNKH